VGSAGGIGWWDRHAGATDSATAARTRIEEDRQALALAGRTAVNLPFLDSQYRQGDQAPLAATVGWRGNKASPRSPASQPAGETPPRAGSVDGVGPVAQTVRELRCGCAYLDHDVGRDVRLTGGGEDRVR
jgi:hypothetical protein